MNYGKEPLDDPPRLALGELEAAYRMAGSGVLEDLDTLLGRYEPLEAVGMVSAAVVEKLGKVRKPKARLAAAVMRGVLAREELKQAEGGSHSADEAGALLGISKVAVLKRFHKGQLLGWREAGQKAVRFPAWQFEGGDVLPGLPEVLAVFAEAPWLDDWARVVFFLTPRSSLAGKRPLDLLREGRTALLKDAARASFE